MILEHERPLVALLEQLHREKLQGCSPDRIRQLEAEILAAEAYIFSNLSTEQRLAISRHPHRLRGRELLQSIAVDIQELHGDRLSGNDPAIIGALAKVEGIRCMVILQERGKTTEERVRCRFGMPMPSGYRKAIRLMQMAARFKLPLVTLIDTPGAYFGLEAEEGGQAWAIAESIASMVELPIPTVSIILGEGCSGGALALCVADSVAVLEHAYFSVIRPEACASILWRDKNQASHAAAALKIQANDLLSLGLIDQVIPEPCGGSHRNPRDMAHTLKAFVRGELLSLLARDPASREAARLERYQTVGRFLECSWESCTSSP